MVIEISILGKEGSGFFMETVEEKASRFILLSILPVIKVFYLIPWDSVQFII